jgi:lauroyl/myristoyl acyltransferase
MGILREYRPGGWRPVIGLTGRERLDEALARGKGAILWVPEFEHSTLIAKMALAKAGYSVSHLSNPEHGFSSSPFGSRIFNRIWTRIEDRYLDERITLQPDQRVGSLRRLAEILKQGRIISITVGNAGVRCEAVPFFDGALQLGTGAVTLARSTQAPLLVVFVLPRPGGGFSVSIEGPLDTRETPSEERPFLGLARLLEEYVRRSPDTWRGWNTGWCESPA